jgi:sensor histidine kinase regulating citrate/malate metabolism
MVGGSHKSLLDRVGEAVIVINAKGDAVYINQAGRQALADTELVALIRRFISFRPGQKEVKATIEMQSASYDAASFSAVMVRGAPL